MYHFEQKLQTITVGKPYDNDFEICICKQLRLVNLMIMTLKFVFGGSTRPSCLNDYSEILHEDRNFNEHELAALVASKVFYHLGSFEDSLTYALGAGDLFDVNSRTEYVDTTIGKPVNMVLFLIKPQ